MTSSGISSSTETDPRVTRITWQQEIKPGEIGEFVFFARNPSNGAAIAWRAHQHFTDGT